MNLEELQKLVKAKALILVSKNGEIVDSYQEKELYDLNNFSDLTKVIINMADDFFTEIIRVKPSNEIIIKSENHFFYLLKCDSNHVLCVLTEGTVNTSLISLSLKKKVKQ